MNLSSLFPILVTTHRWLVFAEIVDIPGTEFHYR